MPINALVLIDTGFETIEALTPVDVLRRLGVDLTLASTTGKLTVVSGQKVSVGCDALVDAVAAQDFDLVLLPGGMPNAEMLGQHTGVLSILRKQKSAKRWIAAICAAPAMVLAKNGLMAGAKGVCYPAAQFTELMGASLIPDCAVHVDRDAKIVTGRGPGAALEFSIAVAEAVGLDCAALKKSLT